MLLRFSQKNKTVHGEINLKKHQTTILTITLILLVLPATGIAQSIKPTIATNEPFSIIWITDTQYLTENNPTYYDNLCQWIVNNSEAYNLKMVVHTGDLVNGEGNLTQWANANKSMSILLNNNIPYCWNAGNHDYNSTCWLGNQFYAFNPQVMQQKTWWVSTESDGKNTAVRFNVSGWECLIINIAYQANNSTLAWVNSLLDANSQSHAIVATHAYLNKQGQYDSWALNLKEKVLDTHLNVFLTLSGHYYPTNGSRIRVGDRDELLFNQQDAYNKTGAASVRILTFDAKKETIAVQTYSLFTGQFLEGENNSFTLTMFRNHAVGNHEFSVGVVAIVVVCIVCFLLYVRRGQIHKRLFLNGR